MIILHIDIDQSLAFPWKKNNDSDNARYIDKDLWLRFT